MAEVKFGMSSAEQARRSGYAYPEAFTPMMPFGGGLFGVNPFAMMKQVAEELDRAYSGPKAGGIDEETWVPKIDWRRTNNTLIVLAELPGVKKEQLKLEITREGLILEGDKPRERTEKEAACRSERHYGHFYRFVPLPEGADTAGALAELNDGVLRVTVPLAEVEENRRAVPVK